MIIVIEFNVDEKRTSWNADFDRNDMIEKKKEMQKEEL